MLGENDAPVSALTDLAASSVEGFLSHHGRIIHLEVFVDHRHQLLFLSEQGVSLRNRHVVSVIRLIFKLLLLLHFFLVFCLRLICSPRIVKGDLPTPRQ